MEILNVDWIGDDEQLDVTESSRDIGFHLVFVRQVGETLQRSLPHKLLDKMPNSVNVLLAVASDACPGPGDAQCPVHCPIVVAMFWFAMISLAITSRTSELTLENRSSA